MASQPSKSGKGGGSSAPTTTPTASVAVKMKWCAYGTVIPGSYSVQADLTINLPSPVPVLQALGTDGTDNIVIVPMPADFVDNLDNRGDRVPLIKPVKGRLPDLHLFPEYTGNNWEQWGAYKVAHPPRSARVSPSDWKHKPLTLAKKES